MRVAVVGHAEWARFALVDHVPSAGEIVHADETWEEVGGGGAVAAVQLARLAGACVFVTALGDDETGARAVARLRELGVDLAMATRPEPQRWVFVHVDAAGERTITVAGPRIVPAGDQPGWPDLGGFDGVYFTGGDAAALRASRRARRLVVTVRAREALATAGVEVDVLVASASDAGERYAPGELEPPPRYIASTEGAAGGTLTDAAGHATRWQPAPLPGPIADTYGAGDSFAAGLTYGLADGRSVDDAIAVGARCGAICMTGRGPFGAELTPESVA